MLAGPAYRLPNVSDTLPYPARVHDNGTGNVTSVPYYIHRIFLCSDPDRLRHLVPVSFYVNALLVGGMCLVGLLGNTLSLLVLRRDQSSKVPGFLLQWLAVADNAVLTVTLLCLSVCGGIVPLVSDRASLEGPGLLYVLLWGNSVASMAQTATIWMTVLLAINRYIAICRPLHAAHLCTLGKARLQVGLVMAFSVFFNIPRLFQEQVVPSQGAWNASGSDLDQYELNQTSIGGRSVFGIVYTNALYSVLVLLLPLLLLLVLNWRLVRALQRSRLEVCRTSGSEARDNISLIMVVIILVFLLCHTPDRCLQVALLFEQPKDCELRFYAYTATNCLFVVNSSTNFVVYYALRKRFRRILAEQICAFWSRNLSERDIPSMTSRRRSTNPECMKLQSNAAATGNRGNGRLPDNYKSLEAATASAQGKG